MLDPLASMTNISLEVHDRYPTAKAEQLALGHSPSP